MNVRIINKKKQENKKIRIVFIIGSLNIGGTEKHLLNLINILIKKYFLFTYIFSTKRDMFSKMKKM